MLAMCTDKHAEAAILHRLLALYLLDLSAAFCVASQTSKPAFRSVSTYAYSFGQEYASQVAAVSDHPDHDHP